MAEEDHTPLSITVRRVTEASEAELQAVYELLGEAFLEDPFTQVVTDHDVEFFGQFHGATVIAGLLGGEVYFAESESKDIVGVAVWFPPERSMFDSPDQQEKALSILMNRFKPELKEWWGTVFIPTFSELQKIPHANWHLQTLATAQKYQRKGVARALIDEVKPKAIADKKLLRLETATPLNVSIYNKLGFHAEHDPITIEGLPGKFNMWSLSLDPN